jgi:hypothetical protein
MKTNSQPFEELGSRSGSVTSTASTRSPGLARINFARRRVNRAVDTVTLLGLLRRRSPRFFELAEVVGRWVWIQFERQPEVDTRQQLAQLGFHWNHARQAWQHPCGVFRDQRVRFDPRRKFGSYFAADRMAA